MRLAKIIATLGPASEDPIVIKRLLQAGVNVFRLNFSHGNEDVLLKLIANVREMAQELHQPVAILGDLQGPKFRIGELENHQPITLENGKSIRFKVGQEPGNTSLITTTWPEMIEELQVGDDVLINDGAIALQVNKRISTHELECTIVRGGMLSERKGINVPGLKLSSISAMTDKDKTDACFALAQGLDYIALSFVRSYHDILYLRQFLQERLPEGQMLPLIIAKIEKPQALNEIDAIIETADGIMVARGDLGVELKAAKVPMVQKMLIQKANDAEKPVITATQILESMIQNPTPTRAEVSDIANAVFDGTDALMLSAESAAGKYPVEAVTTMAQIIEEAESHFGEWHRRAEFETFLEEIAEEKNLKFHQAIAQAACYAAKKAHAKAIIVLSFSGKMALRISKRKPLLPILAFTPHNSVYRRLSLLHGVFPMRIAIEETIETMRLSTEQTILTHGYLSKNEPAVFCVGQTHLTGMSNTLQLYSFGDLVTQQEKQNDSTASEPLVLSK